MATTPTQVRINADTKKDTTALLEKLRLDMFDSVNIFLNPCILRATLPFDLEVSPYSDKTLSAMSEARQISRNPDIKGYTNMEELKAALDD